MAFCRTCVGGDAGLDVEFEFAMEGESGHGVGAVFNGNSGAIEKAGELHHLGERFPVGLFHAGRRSHAGGEQAAADLGRQRLATGWKPRGICPGRCQILVFENAEREVELGVVILQELDEDLHLRGVEVETSGELGRAR